MYTRSQVLLLIDLKIDLSSYNYLLSSFLFWLLTFYWVLMADKHKIFLQAMLFHYLFWATLYLSKTNLYIFSSWNTTARSSVWSVYKWSVFDVLYYCYIIYSVITTDNNKTCHSDNEFIKHHTLFGLVCWLMNSFFVIFCH